VRGDTSSCSRRSFGGPLFQVPAAGGKPKPVTGVPVASTTVSDRWPSFLPDGKAFLCFCTALTATRLIRMRFAWLRSTAATQLLLRGKFYGAHYAAGRLLAVRDGSLLAWKFDPSSGKASGDPVTCRR
jgi:hypothetical protein